MALDEALLDLVADEPGAAVFRTYGWKPPTLSLGYFQSIAEVARDSRWSKVPIVRRPTGGGAIWHDREVTYALVIPRGHALARASRDLYRAVHAVIAQQLVAVGAIARRRGGTDNTLGPDGRPFFCFYDTDPEDIVIGETKVVGSAQRRRSGAVLQHGSLLLRAAPATPELLGVGDLARVAADADDWAEILQGAIPEALGFVSNPQTIPDQVIARSHALERSVYCRPRWTARR
jgi:lipoate-protein ligase A